MSFRKIVSADAESTAILIPLMVGAVFLSEGTQKFLFADKIGLGRFDRIGLPDADFPGPFVGTFEIACGYVVIPGLFRRLPSVRLIAIMLATIATTKAQVLANDGLWEMMHGSRTDWSMPLGSIFLLINDLGKWPVDQKLAH